MPLEIPQHLQRLLNNPAYYAKALPQDALVSVRQETEAALHGPLADQDETLARLNDRFLWTVGSTLAHYAELRHLQKDPTAYHLDIAVSTRLLARVQAILKEPLGANRAKKLAKVDQALRIHIDSNPLNHNRLNRLTPRPSEAVLRSSTRRLRDLYDALDAARWRMP